MVAYKQHPPDRLNVRSTPDSTSDGNILVKLVANVDQVDVLEGPLCYEGHRWWKVRLRPTSQATPAAVGYAREADDKEYWLVEVK